METIETLETYDELMNAAKEAGIKDSKLDEAVELYLLPKTGKFKKLVLKQGENADGVNMSHFAITTTTGEIISMSALQRFGFFGAKEKAIENLKVKQGGANNGTFTLRGVTCKNPKLTGNQVKIGLALEGKTFKATPFDGWLLDYNKDGYATAEDAEESLLQKTFYQVGQLS
jgi:hypothetical protein